MISSSRQKDAQIIIAKPNQSSTWRHNLWLLAAVAVPSLGAAVAFSLLGAWPILPFAGLELAALASALYYVNWKLQYRHVITLDETTVRIDKGHYAPRRSWQFERAQSSLAVTPEKHPWDGPAIALHDKEQTVEVGEILNREDSLLLLSLLRQELRVGTHSNREVRRL